MKMTRQPRSAVVRRTAVLLAVAALALSAAAGTAAAAPAAPTGTTGVTGTAGAGWSAPRAASCAGTGTPAGAVHCFAQYRTRLHTGRTPAVSTPPADGLGPAQIAAADRISGPTASGATIAIVDAQDNPRAEADLAVYRKQYGLPACTTANGCFRKVNQNGKASPLPTGDAGWGVEISLDLDAASAACPACRILLVEGDDPSLDSLGVAVDTAVRLGADVVSNSYGADEFNGMSDYAHYYKQTGASIVASSGDYGFTIAQFPAVLSSVMAVGGTTLTKSADASRGWSEKAWSGAGSGCSAYIAKPAWQHDTNCGTRTVSDVSAVADPDSGFVVYDTYGLGVDNGYIEVGGTSLSSPLIGAMVARAGRVLPNASRVYYHRNSLFDVRSGSNGYCGGDYLCSGKTGYDAPTGNGSPNGLVAV